MRCQASFFFLIVEGTVLLPPARRPGSARVREGRGATDKLSGQAGIAGKPPLTRRRRPVLTINFNQVS